MKAEFNFKAVRRALWKAATAVFNVNSTAKFCSSLVGIKNSCKFFITTVFGGWNKAANFLSWRFCIKHCFFAKSEPCWLSLCLAAEEMKLKKQLSSPSNEEISSLDLGTSQSRIAKVCFGDGWMLLLWMVWQGIWITDKKLALGEIYGQTGCFQARAKFQFY